MADRQEGLRLGWRDGLVQRVGGRHGADQDQHDEAHALLTVEKAVHKADDSIRQVIQLLEAT